MERNLNKGFLLEGKNPVEVAKYYLKGQPEAMEKLTDRDNLLLRKLASLDMEFDPAKFEVGKIFPWLMTMWKKNDPELLSLLKSGPNSQEAAKFRNAQKLFSRPAFKKSLGIADVNRFSSLEDFINRVSAAFVEKEGVPESPRFSAPEINDDIREGNIAKTNISNERYLVVTPLKKKGACKYGNVHMDTNGGRWCTAKEADNAFDSYKDGTLYIFMDRKDGYKSKYQLHYNEGEIQFKNEFNRDFDYEGFFDENTGMFDRLFPQAAEKVRSGQFGSGFGQLYPLLPKAYKQAYRDSLAKNTEGILAALIKASKGDMSELEEIARTGYFGWELDFDDIVFHGDGFTVNIDLDMVGENLSRWYWVYRQGYDGYDFQTDEWDYINNYVPENYKEDLISLIRILNPGFGEDDFNKEGELYEAMTEGNAKKYFQRLIDNFAIEYENAVNSGQSDYVDGKIKGLPFVIGRDSLTFKYDNFVNYCLENHVTGISLEQMVQSILEREDINNENLNNYWETADISYESLKNKLEEDIDYAKDRIEEDMEDMEAYKENYDKLKKYIKDLGFTMDLGGRYRKKTEFAYMVISHPDYEKGTVHMEYMDLKNDKKIHKGDIRIDNLPKYATMQMMFESVRRFVRNILSNSI